MKKKLRNVRALFYKYLFGNPARGMTIIGITGTDGKSTTAEMLYQMFRASGKNAAIISTIGGKINDQVFDTGLHTSTPSTFQIYKALKAMRKEKVTHCVLELTSHGLDQERAKGITLDGAIFTNITPEHLDYHKTFEAYRDAKASMIRMIKPMGFVVINRDDPNYVFLEEYTKKLGNAYKMVFYHLGKEEKIVRRKMYYAFNIHKEKEGFSFDVKLSNITFKAVLYMDGTYNIQNCMAAMSAAINVELPLQGIMKGIDNVRNISGRMDVVQTAPYRVIVDFAHTPNAFAHVLPLLKEKTKGHLIVVFGCAGRRDPGKRKPMGKEASMYADYIIITSEDPRDEPFEDIAAQIIEGIDTNKFIKGKNLFVIPSREEAIAHAIIGIAKDDDCIALLGKGHEESNCIGTIEYPWNEREMALQYIHKKTT